MQKLDLRVLSDPLAGFEGAASWRRKMEGKSEGRRGGREMKEKKR